MVTKADPEHQSKVETTHTTSMQDVRPNSGTSANPSSSSSKIRFAHHALLHVFLLHAVCGVTYLLWTNERCSCSDVDRISSDDTVIVGEGDGSLVGSLDGALVGTSVAMSKINTSVEDVVWIRSRVCDSEAMAPSSHHRDLDCLCLHKHPRRLDAVRRQSWHSGSAWQVRRGLGRAHVCAGHDGRRCGTQRHRAPAATITTTGSTSISRGSRAAIRAEGSLIRSIVRNQRDSVGRECTPPSALLCAVLHHEERDADLGQSILSSDFI